MVEKKENQRLAFDVIIVGAGPSGLAAAIRLKQLDATLSVIVLEKGCEVGAHILSGAIFDPVSLDVLLPDWKTINQNPLQTLVEKDEIFFLTKSYALPISNRFIPKWMHNHGAYIVSLGKLCRWLARQAEEIGVEIFPATSVTDLLFDENDSVIGVKSNDFGRKKDGSLGANFVSGVEMIGKSVFLAEGAGGYLAEWVIKKYHLSQGCDPQKYGLGLKELWRVEPSKSKPGLVQHFLGWPLSSNASGGGFIYHMEDNLVSLGLVVHLDYTNPSLSPFNELQQFKTHKYIASLLEGGKCLSYGARAINQGGWQSVPKLSFPGGMLLGCAAGFVNVPRLKGSHNAIFSGILAAEHFMLQRESAENQDMRLEKTWRESSIGKDLKRAKNFKPLVSRWGGVLGSCFATLDIWCTTLLGFSLLGTLSHKKSDFSSLRPLKQCKKIEYPKTDKILTFDLSSSIFFSGVHHEHDQPCHLKIKDMPLQLSSEYHFFGGPSSAYCPAGVYEWIQEKEAEARLLIHPENCLHCKACVIKDPNQNIVWKPPEGGGGPFYREM